MAPASDIDLFSKPLPPRGQDQQPQPPPGQRLLCNAIDHFANTAPERIWASTPRSANLAEGFVDITYGEWSNAINHAAQWLDATFKARPAGESLTIVYRGPYDVRYPTLYVAGIKTSIRMLCLSYTVSVENQLNLLQILNCDAIVHPGDDPFLEQLQARRPSLKSYIAPAIADWFTDTPAAPYPRPVAYADVAGEPAIVFHTSGTTGAEKPFLYTNRMLGAIDINGANPRLPPTATPKMMDRRRWYTSFPLHTVIGMQPVVPMAVFWGSIPIINPYVKYPMPSATDVLAVLQHGKPDGLQAAPKQLDEICRLESAQPLLSRLLVVQYAGSKLARATGDILTAKGCHLQAMIGSTEAGGYPTLAHNHPDWHFLKFAPVPGLEFRPWAPPGASPSRDQHAVNALGTTGDITALRGPPLSTSNGTPSASPTTNAPKPPETAANPPAKPTPAAPGLYQLVFVYNPKLPHGQQIFTVKPELKAEGFFGTGDIFRPHPHVPGMWLMEGRTVDFLEFPSQLPDSAPVKLSNGDGRSQSPLKSNIFNVSIYEDALLSAAGGIISGVVAGGAGQSRPYVLIEMRKEHDNVAAQRAVLVTVGELNERLMLSGNARVSGKRVLFAQESRKFIWNAKDVVNRDGTAKAFAAEINCSLD